MKAAETEAKRSTSTETHHPYTQPQPPFVLASLYSCVCYCRFSRRLFIPLAHNLSHTHTHALPLSRCLRQKHPLPLPLRQLMLCQWTSVVLCGCCVICKRTRLSPLCRLSLPLHLPLRQNRHTHTQTLTRTRPCVCSLARSLTLSNSQLQTQHHTHKHSHSLWLLSLRFSPFFCLCLILWKRLSKQPHKQTNSESGLRVCLTLSVSVCLCTVFG